MTREADAIASAVLKQFAALPPKRKPQARDNGCREWVPLSGIVARHGDGSLKCLALATGMKCLPQNKLPSANGTVLHDWHAEVLAIRSLNHFILQECKAILAAESDHQPYDSPYIRRRTKQLDDDVVSHSEQHHHQQQHQPPFIWKEDVTLHMYCSEAPCGDASMELTMSAQEDASPWASPLPPHILNRTHNIPPTISSSSSSPSSPSSWAADHTTPTPDLLLLGRACFSHLGVVRRKPARPDAPPTLSKSCSDKLALRQCTSLLSSVVSLLVTPTRGVYLRSLILPASQYSATGCERCFSGRMVVKASWFRGRRTEGDETADGCGGGGGYAFRPFAIETTTLEFSFSRRGLPPAEGDHQGTVKKYVASSLATAWSANGLAENIVGGVCQGRKQTDPRGGSQVSRAKMWDLAREVAELAAASSAKDGKDGGHGDDDVVAAVPNSGTYHELKEIQALRSRRRTKEDVITGALKGWVKNTGDEQFRLAV